MSGADSCLSLWRVPDSSICRERGESWAYRLMVSSQGQEERNILPVNFKKYLFSWSEGAVTFSATSSTHRNTPFSLGLQNTQGSRGICLKTATKRFPSLSKNLQLQFLGFFFEQNFHHPGGNRVTNYTTIIRRRTPHLFQLKKRKTQRNNICELQLN